MLQQMQVYKGGGYNEVRSAPVFTSSSLISPPPLHHLTSPQLIFEWEAWVERLPGALEAFFLRPTSSAAQRAEAHSQREAFISEYRLKEGGAPPMLMYDEKRTSGPFSDVADF